MPKRATNVLKKGLYFWHMLRVRFSRMQGCLKLTCLVTVVGQPTWGLQRFPMFHFKENGQSYFLLKKKLYEKMSAIGTRWGWSLKLCFVKHLEWRYSYYPPPQKFQQNKESLYLTAVHQGLYKYLTAKDTHISPISIKHSKTLLSHSNLL